MHPSSLSTKAKQVYHKAYNYGMKLSPEEEKVLTKESLAALWYAWDIVKGRWEPGEAAIATDADDAYWYAREVIRDRWQPGEAIIAKDAIICKKYIKFILRFHEKYATDPDFMAFVLTHG